MPVGAAFYVWDHGVKRGDIQLLGAASYLAPLLSTLILILAGFGAFSAADRAGGAAHHRRRGAGLDRSAQEGEGTRHGEPGRLGALAPRRLWLYRARADPRRRGIGWGTEPMSTATDDPRIGRGMAAQLAARRERIAAGEKPIGWKVGFGTQAAMQRFGLAAPLVGFLTDRGLVPVRRHRVARRLDQAGGRAGDRRTDGAATSARAPTRRRRGRRFPPSLRRSSSSIPTLPSRTSRQSSPAMSFTAMSSWARPARLPPEASVDGLTGRVRRNGAEAAATSDLEANAGKILPIVAPRRRSSGALRRKIAGRRFHHRRIRRAAAPTRCER